MSACSLINLVLKTALLLSQKTSKTGMLELVLVRRDRGRSRGQDGEEEGEDDEEMYEEDEQEERPEVQEAQGEVAAIQRKRKKRNEHGLLFFLLVTKERYFC
jgi:hypothetical protein